MPPPRLEQLLHEVFIYHRSHYTYRCCPVRRLFLTPAATRLLSLRLTFVRTAGPVFLYNTLHSLNFFNPPPWAS